MKQLRKLFAFVMTVFMSFAIAAPALAASIDVTNVVNGEQYTAYKVLNYTTSGDAYSYYLTDSEYTAIGSVLEAAGFAFTPSSDGTQYYVNNSDQEKSGAVDVAVAAAYLGEHTTDLRNALGKYGPYEGENGEVDFGQLPTGYYFVTTSAGSLCALHEDGDIAKVVEKNTIPTIDKREKTTEEAYSDGPVYANIGDEVHYQIIVKDGTGTDAVIKVTDTMSGGLDYKAGSLMINGTLVADSEQTADWTVNAGGRSISIEFSADYVKTLPAYYKDKETGAETGAITITYDATINSKAIINHKTDANGNNITNENKAELEYSHQKDEDKVYVETYDISLLKTDGSKALSGAEFNIFTQETDGTALTFSKDNTGYYYDATGSTKDAKIEAGDGKGVNIRGLAPGTYWFEETKEPQGYNKLATRQSVTIAPGATATAEIPAAAQITVVNQAGTQLPTTGGIGTTIFYVVGGVLVVGAVVFLLTKRRMAGEE